MLIEFTVENYLSFRDAATLSMSASKQVSELAKRGNVIEFNKQRVLSSAVIYGANASGKSNLLKALVCMRSLVINSSKESQSNEPIDVVPFKLEANMLDKPSRFEVLFSKNERMFRYGFEADAKAVAAEWLFECVGSKEIALFLREGEGIDLRPGFEEGKQLESKTRSNALFLSVAANFNGDIAGQVVEWFSNLKPIQRQGYGLFENASKTVALEDSNLRELLMALIKAADLGIEDILVSEVENEQAKEMEKYFKDEFVKEITPHIPATKTSLRSVHQTYTNGVQTGTIAFDFEREESEGTQKLLKVAGGFLIALRVGYTLIVDELDAKFHPFLTRMLIRLFHSQKWNQNGAQLIFTTHDANLLEHGGFRRDQIWFTEKDNKQGSDLYSLAEIKITKEDGTESSVRKDASYRKGYFKGRYGAVPYLGDIDELLGDD